MEYLRSLKANIKQKLRLGSRDVSSISSHTTRGNSRPSTWEGLGMALPSSSAHAPTNVMLSETAILQHQSTGSQAAPLPGTMSTTYPPLASTRPPTPPWSPTARGTTPSVRRRSKSPAWAGLKALLKVLESTASAFGPLKSAIGGLNQSIDIFEGAAKGRNDFNELRTMLNVVLDDLSQFFGYSTPAEMSKSMYNLCNAIRRELKLVEAKRKRGPAQQYAEALGDADEVLGHYQRIHGYLARIKLNANLNMWKIVDEQAMEARLKELSRDLSAVYDSAESETIGRGPCTLGTRENEIARLTSWARSDTAQAIYWMNGMAGTGKTTIAYSFCVDLDKSAELGASFFCCRSLPECRKVRLIIPSLAYQLARFSGPFRYALSEALKSNPDVQQRVLEKQFESLIVQPLREVKHTLPSDFVVVIDALEECEDERSVGKFLDILLAETTTSDLPIRFLVSSRPEPEIYQRMAKQVDGDSNNRLVLHQLDTAIVKQDIKTYLKEELKDVALTDSQINALVEQSGGLFIYASTAARCIRDGLKLMEHKERLNRILRLSPSLPDGFTHRIDVLYSTVLEVASRRPDFSASNRSQMKMILDTVVCAQEPMTVDVLAGLLKLQSGDLVEALLRPISTVVNISETNRLVTTLHSSFSDFLFDRERSANFYCDPRANHGRLVQVCFELIKTNDSQFDICGLETPFQFDDENQIFMGRADQAVSPELFYACRYWVAHLELSERPPNIAELLDDFLSKRLLLWMEVLHVKRGMHLGARIMERVESWSITQGISKETIELAHNAWCFVTMFASHTVSQSTPHICASMLPFLPESGSIYQHYMRWVQGKIEPQGSAR